MATRKKNFGMGGYGAINSAYLKYYNRHLIVADWSVLEPSPGTFAWSALDQQVATLSSAGLNIDVVVRINPKPFVPGWIFKAPYNVPIVNLNGSSLAYAFYLDTNGVLRNRYYMMLNKLADHLVALSGVSATGNIVAIQTAEGHETLPQAYLGIPLLSRFAITTEEFLQWQKDAWQHVYDYTKTTDANGEIVEKIDIFLNATKNADVRSYILTNLPYAGIKAASEGNDYGQNLESFDFDTIADELTQKTTDPGSLRKRSELSTGATKTWFTQAYNKNMLQVALYSLTKGNDIWTLTDNSFIKDATFGTFLSALVNELAGNDAPSKQSSVAWWAANTRIDGVDTTRFSTGTYGHVLTNGSDTSDTPLDYVKLANITRLKKIQTAMGCGLITAQYGVNAKANRIDDDKYLQDIGMKVRQEPLGRWMTEPNWLAESKPYWRLGGTLEYWGRYAVGFAATSGTGSKLFFLLDTDFKTNLYGITVTIVYWNQGNCQWRVRNKPAEVAKAVTNSGTQSWQTVTFDIDTFLAGQLTSSNDLSVEYVSGNNTVRFAFIKIVKKTITNEAPVVTITPSQQTAGGTATITATGTDADGIDTYAWRIASQPEGANAAITDPNLPTTDVSGITAIGDYVFTCRVTDTRGAWTEQSVTITKVTPAVVAPTANAGPDKTITLPTNSTSVGGTDTPGDFSIASRHWTVVSKPTGATDPGFGTVNQSSTTVTALNTDGTYVVRKTVSDNQDPANTNTDDVSITVNSETAITSTSWGALMLGTAMSTDQKISLSDNLTVDLIRTSSTMSNYAGASKETFLINIRRAGKKVALNINWNNPGPRDFVHGTDLELYLNRMDDIIVNFKDIIEFVTIENEPDNNGYFNHDGSNPAWYIEQVRRAIIVAHNRGVKINCGCVHVANANSTTGFVGALKDAWTNELVDLDYVNIHGYYPRDTQTEWTNAINDIKAAKTAGQIIISDECGVKNQDDPDTIISSEATGLVNVIKNLKLKFAVITATGAGGIAKPLNVEPTTTLNENGLAFKRTI